MEERHYEVEARVEEGLKQEVQEGKDSHIPVGRSQQPVLDRNQGQHGHLNMELIHQKCSHATPGTTCEHPKGYRPGNDPPVETPGNPQGIERLQTIGRPGRASEEGSHGERLDQNQNRYLCHEADCLEGVQEEQGPEEGYLPHL